MQISDAERALWGDEILEAYDTTEGAYNAARDGLAAVQSAGGYVGELANVVEHLRRAKDELSQARVKAGL